jgi:hypothetical protein
MLQGIPERYRGTMVEYVKDDVQLFKPLSELTIPLSILKLGDPSNDRFRYPSNKSRTATHVETMRTAERNLDEFWAAVDKHLDENNLTPVHTKTQR